jgi:hypothetical protein
MRYFKSYIHKEIMMRTDKEQILFIANDSRFVVIDIIRFLIAKWGGKVVLETLLRGIKSAPELTAPKKEILEVEEGIDEVLKRKDL